MHSDIRTKIVNILSNKINWEGRQLEKINGMSRFAYEAIKAYLNGPNKTVKLFYDDVQVVIETDPLTQLDLIYLERKTEQSRARITSLANNVRDISIIRDISRLRGISIKPRMVLDMSVATDIYEEIEDLENDMIDLVEDYVSSFEDQFYVNSYSRACDFLSNKEIEEMRAKFGFDKPVTQSQDEDNDVDDSNNEDSNNEDSNNEDSNNEDSDDEESDDDRNERIFSEKEPEIFEWLLETKSYESWAEQNYSVALEQIDIQEKVNKRIDINDWQESVLDNYLDFSNQNNSIFEWTNGTLAEQWRGDDAGDVFFEEDFEEGRPDSPPANTYFSSSFIDFYDTLILNLIFYNNTCTSAKCSKFFLETENDETLQFLNPNANVCFNVNIEYTGIGHLDFGALINLKESPIVSTQRMFTEFPFHFGYIDKLKKVLITHY